MIKGKVGVQFLFQVNILLFQNHLLQSLSFPCLIYLEINWPYMHRSVSWFSVLFCLSVLKCLFFLINSIDDSHLAQTGFETPGMDVL